jgi:hypothetical protein
MGSLDRAGGLRAKPKAAQLDGFIDFRPALRRSGRGIAFGGNADVSRAEAWFGTKPSSARTKEYTLSAPIEPMDIGAIVSSTSEA